MKIVKSNEAQLCNRLWSYTVLIAHSLKFKEKILIMDFEEYADLFYKLDLFSEISFVKNKYKIKCIDYLLKISRVTHTEKEFDLTRKTKGITSIFGWDYRSENIYLDEYKDSICKLFSPRSDVVKKCSEAITEIKAKKILVGVHIRRGDYKTFFDGAYYFNNAIYKNYMNLVETELLNKENKEVCFLITAAEKIDINDFSGLDCKQLPSASSIEDLYSLSLCDYIIGPPSTFSMWASFYGNVPLRILKKEKEELMLGQFKIIASVDVFKDKSVFEHIIQTN